MNTLRPNFLDTLQKLAEARRRQELPGLRQQAEKALADGHWAAATGALEKICKLAPEDHSAPRQLAAAQQQAQLASLYASARQFTQEGQWAAALRAWEQIDGLQTGYPDPENLRQVATDSAAAEKVRQEAEALYVAALTELNSGGWAAGAEKLRRVQALAPGLQESAALLRLAEGRLAEQAEGERRAAEAAKVDASRKAAAELEARRQAAIQAELDRLAAAEARAAQLEAERQRLAAQRAASQRTDAVRAATPLVWKDEAPQPSRVTATPGKSLADRLPAWKPAWKSLARQWVLPLLVVGIGFETARLY